MQGRLSLRERLLVVMAAGLLPLAIAIAWIAARENSASIELTQSQLRFAASLLAANQDRAVDAAEQMLGAVATAPELRTAPHARCQAYFEGLRRQYPIYADIGLLAPDGHVLCHAQGALGEASAKDRDYFKRAIASRHFVMGEPIVGIVSGKLAVPFAYPVVENGEVTSVAFASLDLAVAAESLAHFELPPGARVVVADRSGHVLMEHPAPTSGRALHTSTDPALREAARTLKDAVGESVDTRGDPRIFAIAPSRPVGDGGFIVRVAMTRRAAIHGIWAQALEVIAGLALLLVSAFISVWWFGGRMIVKPAKQILGVVRRLERGHLDARTPVHGGRGEFARIGSAFNLMAESLQQRQAALEAELGRSRGAYTVLDQVLNSMQEGIIAVTADGRFLMYNEAAARLFPMTDVPVLPALWPGHFGVYHSDRTTPYKPEELPLVLSALGDSGTRQQVFVRNALVPEGRVLQCSWQPLQGGDVQGGLVVFTDVTELHQLQSKQASQFARLAETQRKLVESQRIGRVGNWELDLKSGRLWWSDEVFALFGVPHDGFDGTLQAFERHVHPDDRPLLKPARDRALRDGEVLEIEYRVIKPDGAVAWMYEIAEARRDEGGHPVWFGGLMQDITQRKQQAIENTRLLEQVRELNASLESRIVERTGQLARQELLYRTLAEQAPEVVWNTDRTGRATYFNRAWYDLVGGEPADWLGDGWVARVHPEDIAEVRRNWVQARDSLSAYTGTRRILARDGTYHTMSYKGAPVVDPGGEVTSWVGIDADITQFKAIESALRGSNQELEAFSYSVSHDLRAPLGAIAGFSRALADKLGTDGDEKARHYLARMRAGVGKMEQLIDAMLQLSRVVRAPLEWVVVDLGAMASDALEGLRMQDATRRVQATVDEGLLANGDARLLRLVIENLVGNAWKFTAHTGDARIHVGRGEDGAFFVRDNGVGFDMAYAGKLFTAFQRLHTEAEFPGTGIGLATVRRIIARHEGRVWAESEPGRGTTFCFSLPRAVAPAWYS